MMCSSSRNYVLNVFVLLLMLGLSHGADNSSASPKIKDVHTTSDLPVYLKSIERIIDYCEAFSTFEDLNLYFGVFLLNANIKHAMLSKNTTIPLELKSHLVRMFESNTELLKSYQYKIKTNTIKTMSPGDRNISLLVDNIDPWVKNMKAYKLVLHKKVSHKSDKRIHKLYSSYEAYMENNLNFAAVATQLELSDRCAASLERSTKRPPYKCSLSQECSDFIVNDSPDGYVITHRVLMLMVVRSALQCFVKNTEKDDLLITELCSAVYNEARYIALHGYAQADLFMEQICLCSLPGHSEFQRRSWFKKILTFQLMNGCFTYKLLTGNKEEDMKRSCNEHATAVAIASLGAAIRYIVETYY